MQGQVVAGIGGDRERYAPIDSVLSERSELLPIAEGLLSVYEFRTLYIADLDAIRGIGHHADALRELRSSFPQLELWVDCGIRNRRHYRQMKSMAKWEPVIGSETYEEEKPAPLPGEAILSLDYRGDRPMGNSQICNLPRLWPGRVIVLNIARVGRQSGPDLEHLKHALALSPRTEVYVGGGMRNADDLEKLKRAGASGALVSTALHSGQIIDKDLAAFADQA